MSAPLRARRDPPLRKPSWIKIRLRTDGSFQQVRGMVQELKLHTVCQEARCPNIFECFSNRTATFMILGDNCTRRCGFCAVGKGLPAAVDPLEPRHVAEAVRAMGLSHAVVTSVDRDDLGDQGSAQFVRTIESIRALNPGTRVEVLIPDFQGDAVCLQRVLGARPEILNHNMETVERLYRRVRTGSDYRRSLELLARAGAWRDAHPQAAMLTKSGLMAGLGESFGEILTVMDDLRSSGVDIMTIGQYLRPSMKHLPVERYVPPEEFARLKEEGLSRGFRHVESGPLVRSSYHAGEQSAQAAGPAAP
ncbi:MAG TPA: lipoyl synthase [Candidatus Polarisedimenticolia bacterium]|nr:lipoyl synthase [Candidatus Polarisedimenticolia bacterium]